MGKNKKITSLRTIVVSSAVSVTDVLFSFVAATITGSTVMLAQGLQGLADLTTTVFLFFGVKRSEKDTTKDHPFGYGRELFFWVLISSLFAFVFSGAFAMYNAIKQIIEAGPIESVHLAIFALSFGVLTNGYSLMNSLKRLSYGAKKVSLVEYIKNSSLVETKMTLLVDLMGTLSAIFGLFALSLYQITGNSVFDGIGALIIGMFTALGALLVIVDLRGFIVGRSPGTDVVNSIKSTAIGIKGVQDVLDLRAVTIGSGKIFVILEIHFEDDMSTDEIEVVTDEIKAAVQVAEPQIEQVQVEVESPE